MADVSPEDIKDPEEPLPPDDEEQDADEDEKKEEEKPPDLAAAAYHLAVAVAELARASGSPPAVSAALQQARAALGK